MKEYNLMEAVEYLKNNPDAKFISNNNEFTLIISNDGALYSVRNDSSCETFALAINDFESKWILQALQRTHAEIMKNWFKTKRNDMWLKVEAYIHEKSNTAEKYLFDEDWHDKEFFNDLEMKTDEKIQEMED